MERIKVGVIALVLGIGVAAVCRASMEPVTDFDAAMDRGKAEGKMIFIQFGREACGNCQALKSMIRGGQVRLRDSEMVYADLNCDDSKTSRKFHGAYKVDGRMLPFVVIADPSGHQLAARSGAGSAEEFMKLIKEARKQWVPKPAAGGGASSAAGMTIAAKDGREARLWTLKSGVTYTASLYSQTASFVVLKKTDGTKCTVSTASLSGTDIGYLNEVRSGESDSAAPQGEK